MLVVDASVIAPAIADDGPDGDKFRHRLGGQRLAAPDLLYIEVLSVLRRHAAAKLITVAQAEHAIEDLLDLPMLIVPAAAQLQRAWSLRANLTVYDATYIALAEVLDCPLLTADRRLAKAPGARCAIEVI